MANEVLGNLRVAHISSVHSPYDIRIFRKECISLSKAGYEVFYIVRHTKNETKDGVNIVGVPTEKGRLARMVGTVWKIYKETLQINPRIIHFHDPELIPIGLLLKLHSKTVIYDVHEDLPRQILTKDYLHPLVRYPVSIIAAAVEWLATRTFITRIITATEKIGSRFPARKTTLIQNYPLVKELVCGEPASFSARPDNLIYMGGISRIRGAVECVSAVGLTSTADCKLMLAGEFESKQLQNECRQMDGWKNVNYLGWLDRNQLREALNTAVVGLVLFHPVPNHIDAQPNKLFEYMSAGIPVIVSDFPLWRKIVEASGCGVLVDPMDPHLAATAIDRLLADKQEAKKMGAAGQKAVLERYNWNKEEKKLINLYKDLES